MPVVSGTFKNFLLVHAEKLFDGLGVTLSDELKAKGERRRESKIKYRRSHRESLQIANALYKLRHKEAIKAYAAKWYDVNRETVLACSKVYYMEHRDEVLNRQKEYNKAHRVERAEYMREYRKRKKELNAKRGIYTTIRKTLILRIVIGKIG